MVHTQGKRNPSKMVGVARGCQRADTLKHMVFEARLETPTMSNAWMIFIGYNFILESSHVLSRGESRFKFGEELSGLK